MHVLFSAFAHIRMRRFRTVAVVLFAACASDLSPLTGGGSEGAKRPTNFDLTCNLPTDQIYDGGPGRDGIPSLLNPPLVAPDSPEASYLDEYAAVLLEEPRFADLRVIGLLVRDQAVAIPHNILWWHEIVNIDLGGRRLAVTYCPLTASAIVFDATRNGTHRFGVSGLVYLNNLMMFDPETESLWPQMLREARCGRLQGTKLVTVPHIEMRWDAWKALHPNTQVVSSATGWDRPYNEYPYDLYESRGALLLPMRGIDKRREMKERVLGVPFRSGGMAFPFGELEALGALAAVNAIVGGNELVVLWDSAARAVQAYEPRTDQGRATLRVESGVLVDEETASTWTVDGRASGGARAGEQLVAVSDAFVAFWFAWAAFYPQTELWLP